MDVRVRKCVSQLSLSPHRITQQHMLHRQARSRIELWKVNDAKFVETRAFRKINELIMERNFVTIIGKSGDGKTSLARHIALQLVEMNYQLLIIEQPDDLKNLDTNQVVFIDDAFGKSQVDPDSVIRELLTRSFYLDECVRNKNVILIVTSRDYIYEDCLETFKDISVFCSGINLSEGELVLDKAERLDIIKQYAPSNTDELQLIEIANSEFYQGYPIICRLFGSDSGLQASGLKMFASSLPRLLQDRLKHIENKQPKIYFSLAYLMLMDGAIPVDSLASFGQTFLSIISGLSRNTLWINRSLFEQLKGEMNLPYMDMQEISTILNDERNKMTSLEEGKFTFSHESFTEAIVQSFNKKHVDFFIRTCSVVSLQQRLCVCSGIDKKSSLVKIDSRHYMTFANRLTNEIWKGNISFLLQNECLFSCEFVDSWIEHLNTWSFKNVKCLLETTDTCGNNMLFWIQKYGSIPMLKFLLDKQITRPSYLVTAAAEGRLSTVNFLLKYGIDVNERNSLQQTAILAAAKNGQWEITQLLLEHNADPSISDARGQNAIHIAASKGHVDIVVQLHRNGSDINCLCHFGCTPLYYASLNGQCEIVNILLQRHADVNMVNIYGGNALIAACSAGHEYIVNLLLSYKADPNVRDYCGRLALHWVCQKGYGSVLELLLGEIKHKDIYARDKFGHTSLDLAISHGDSGIIQRLTEITITRKSFHQML